MQPDRPEHEPEPEPEPELQRAFDAWKPAPARAAFREKLRELFVQPGSASADESVSSEVVVAPELAEALDAYAPAARPEFRDRLHDEFVSSADTAVSDPGVGGEATAPRVAQADRGRWRLLLGGAGGLLAAAAALVLWILQPEIPSWSIDPEGFVAAGLTIDDVALSENTTLVETSGLLSKAKTVSTGAQPVRLMLGDLFVVELAESSTLDLSRMPEDLSQGDLVLYGVEGGFRVATGPKFKYPQRKLRFETKDVDVEVVGTVFGVDLFPSFTCVCCFEGEVATHSSTGLATPGAVKAKSTSIVYKDGKPPKATLFGAHMVRLDGLSAYWPR